VRLQHWQQSMSDVYPWKFASYQKWQYRLLLNICTKNIIALRWNPDWWLKWAFLNWKIGFLYVM
jgi:hypothetical protein